MYSIQRPDGAERGAERHPGQGSERQRHQSPTQASQYAAGRSPLATLSTKAAPIECKGMKA